MGSYDDIHLVKVIDSQMQGPSPKQPDKKVPIGLALEKLDFLGLIGQRSKVTDHPKSNQFGSSWRCTMCVSYRLLGATVFLKTAGQGQCPDADADADDGERS